MQVLVLGATGFVGSRLIEALARRGHVVACGARRRTAASACHRFVHVDFAQPRDRTPAEWCQRLEGIDAVVNTVGVFHEGAGQRYDDLHVRGPKALYRACVEMGVRHVVQVSALGAASDAPTAFLRSKHRADESLLACLPDAIVVQPSLIFGAGGASAAWLTTLASLPWVPVPPVDQRVQPIHIDDVVDALVRLLESPGEVRGSRIVFAGPEQLTLRGYLAQLRGALGLPPARFVPVPSFVMDAAAWLGSALGLAWLNRASWHMLRRGNTGDIAAMRRLIGRSPRTVQAFVPVPERPGWRAQARLRWLVPLCRLSLAAVWVISGVVSVWFFPVSISLAWLERVGLSGGVAVAALWSAAAVDVVLGVACLAWPRRRLWLLQAALVLFYTAVITWRLPAFWAHPYGPVLKNLPILVLLLLLHTFEERR